MLSQAEYHRPTDVESACRLLDTNDDAVVVAGGQSLTLLLKEGIVTPEVVVDINDIDELEGIERRDGELRFGALTTHRTIETSALVGEEVPVLGTAASEIADVQIRNAGTIGGVVAYADPTADYPPVLLALDARIASRTAEGTNEYDAREFFTGYYQSALGPAELVTDVYVPTVGAEAGGGFEKLAYRENDRAVVNAAAAVTVHEGTCTAAGVGVGGVADRPRLATDAAEALVGTELTDEDLAAAGAAAREEVPVSADPSIPEEYRAEMVENLTTNALRTARANARDRE